MTHDALFTVWGQTPTSLCILVGLVLVMIGHIMFGLYPPAWARTSAHRYGWWLLTLGWFFFTIGAFDIFVLHSLG